MYKQYKMSAPRQELTLAVDWDIIDACNGFTFDMGGSVMKIVFVDKKEWVEPDKRKKGSKGTLHMVNFSRKELDSAYKLITDRVRIPKSTDGKMPTIYSCGFGGSQFGEEIKEKIKVQNEQLMELDSFNASFLYLVKNLPRKDVLHPVYKPAFEKMIKQNEMLKQMMAQMAGKSDIIDNMVEGSEQIDSPYEQLAEKDLDKPLSADKELFPCAIVMCGSAFGFSVVEADGTNRIVKGSTRGGKMFLGLGSLLAETNSYEELIDLCSKGNAFNVTTSANDAMEGVKSAGENDSYAAWVDIAQENPELEEVCFCFGKADGKRIADFRREDLARCVLDTMINDLAYLAMDGAVEYGIKHVFFCGGFVNHPLVRQELTYYWLKAAQDLTMLDASKMKGEKHIHFMRHAQSLGAIGALLNHKLKWSEKSEGKQN